MQQIWIDFFYLARNKCKWMRNKWFKQIGTFNVGWILKFSCILFSTEAQAPTYPWQEIQRPILVYMNKISIHSNWPSIYLSQIDNESEIFINL